MITAIWGRRGRLLRPLACPLSFKRQCFSLSLKCIYKLSKVKSATISLRPIILRRIFRNNSLQDWLFKMFKFISSDHSVVFLLVHEFFHLVHEHAIMFMNISVHEQFAWTFLSWWWTIEGYSWIVHELMNMCSQGNANYK